MTEKERNFIRDIKILLINFEYETDDDEKHYMVSKMARLSNDMIDEYE